jgi:hypothetical protein
MTRREYGDVVLVPSGLIRPSLFKPVIATLWRDRILRALGSLSDADRVRLREVLRQTLGAGSVTRPT